jgi:hypothetical protein
MNESFLKTETMLKILIFFLACRIHKNDQPDAEWMLDVLKEIKKEIEVLKENELNKET